MDHQVNYDFVIIGAGVSGLHLANRLVKARKKVLVIEKSRSVGGRLATRRDGSVSYDHGAQFYKIKANASQIEIGSQSPPWNLWFKQEDANYFVFPEGMNKFAKFRSIDLDVKLNQKVTKLEPLVKGGYRVATENGYFYNAEAIVLSCPLPQSLQILNDSMMSYPNDLKSVRYAKALVGLFEPHQPGQELELIKYLQEPDDFIFSISNQKSKMITSKLAFTVVMNANWSESHFDLSDEKILNLLTSHFQRYLSTKNLKFDIAKSQLKKWKYSHPLSKYNSNFVHLENGARIFLIGDAFGGGSINGAIRSAEELFLSMNV